MASLLLVAQSYTSFKCTPRYPKYPSNLGHKAPNPNASKVQFKERTVKHLGPDSSKLLVELCLELPESLVDGQ